MIIIPDCTQQHTGFRSQIPVQNVFADQGDDQNNDHYLKRRKAFWNDFIYQIILENGTFKKEIAKNAFKLLEEGDVIFLDISTTNIELIRLIVEANLKITVVTNMIDVMLSFTAPSDTKLLFIGGKLNRGRDGFIGSYTNKQVSEFWFDKAFMGVVGVDLDRNKVYTYATDDAMTKKAIMDASDECYMLMENGKFSREGNYRYANVEDFTGIITNEEPSEEILSKLSGYDIQIMH